MGFISRSEYLYDIEIGCFSWDFLWCNGILVDFLMFLNVIFWFLTGFDGILKIFQCYITVI